MTPQHREPKGIPTGGQFTGRHTGEPDVELTSFDADADTVGTYRFPPVIYKEAELVEFWTQCPISDEDLWAFQQMQRRTQDQVRSEVVARWEQDNPPRRRRGNIEEGWHAAREKVAEDAARNAPYAPDTLVRSLARVQRMWEHRRHLTPKAQDRLARRGLVMRNGYRDTVTGLIETYGLDRFHSQDTRPLLPGYQDYTSRLRAISARLDDMAEADYQRDLNAGGRW